MTKPMRCIWQRAVVSALPVVLGLALLAIGVSPGRAQIVEDEDGGPVTKVAELMQYVQLSIESGRIVAGSNRQGISLTTESRDLSSGRWERLTLDLSNTSPGLRYECKTAQDEVIVEISDGDHLIARRAAKDNTAAMEFEQQPGVDLTLSLGSGEERRTVRATTLWHLLLVEPAGSRQLIPLLETLCPSWKLSARVAAIETALVRWAESGRRFNRSRLARLVQTLGDPRYVARRGAERELASIGEPALMYLAALRRRDLDAEQWQRVQSLLAVMAGAGEDTIDRSVVWLAGDPGIWLALFERDDLGIRRSAVQELRLLLERPIDFDPAASADKRFVEIKRLRSLIQKLEAAELLPAGEGE